MAGSVLIVDMDSHAVETLRTIIEEAGWEARGAYEWSEMANVIAGRRFTVVMAETSFTSHDGLDVISWLLRNSPNSAVVALTGKVHSGGESADYMSRGARFTLRKPYGAAEVSAILSEIEKGSNESFDFCGMIGRSTKMTNLYETIRAVAQTESTALILGETGTGKELVAEAIHSLGKRSGKKFVTINCGALSETLLETELFGHEKGAFTGAFRSRPGKFEYADGGTAFLDEIGEISPSTQIKLLKVIETGEVERLGGNDVIKTDVRMIFATNRDLAAETAAGKFRRDLFYRLNSFPIHVPPLRERGEDIPALASHFAKIYGARHGAGNVTITAEAIAALSGRRWEGNVRELENVMERAVIIARGGVVTAKDVTMEMGRPVSCDGPDLGDLAALSYRQMSERVLTHYGKSYFTALLESCGGKISAAAKKAGLDRKTFYSKLSECGLNPGDFRGDKND